MTERVGGTPVVSLSAHLRPYISGDVSGHFRCPSPVTSGRTSPATFLAAIVAHHLHLVLLLSPATFSAFTVARHLRLVLLLSPATFSAHIVARHLRLSLSGYIPGPYRCPSPPSSPAALSDDISGPYRRLSPPPIPLRRHFGAFPSPATSAVHLRRRSGPFPLPVTPAVPLRRRFGAESPLYPFSLPCCEAFYKGRPVDMQLSLFAKRCVWPILV